MNTSEGSAPRNPIQVTTEEFTHLIETEYAELPTFPAERLIELQNNAMKRLYAAEKRSRRAAGAPCSIQAQARQAQEDAIAYAEEMGGLELEAF